MIQLGDLAEKYKVDYQRIHDDSARFGESIYVNSVSGEIKWFRPSLENIPSEFEHIPDIAAWRTGSNKFSS